MPIQILPARLANQIAAGEVVERPASVVKELVENSIDAGATRIEIDIEKGGSKLIRIRDNGSGVNKNELELALSRHATSKISCLDDLEAIMSLGFRGEALASISSVSRLTFSSRTQAQTEGWSAYTEGRDMLVKIKPTAHPVGTTVEVVDLFFNTPARRKFMRTDKTEFGHIDELLKRIALSRFNIDILLRHNGSLIRQYRAASNHAQKERRLAAVCGLPFVKTALEITLEHQGLSLHGWICSPEGARAQNDIQHCFVNNRMMKDKLINHAIRQGYEQSLPSERFAAYVLYIDIDPHDVDVNVHPAKHEVRFHQARLVHDFIYQGVADALSQVISPTNSMSLTKDASLLQAEMSSNEPAASASAAHSERNQDVETPLPLRKNKGSWEAPAPSSPAMQRIYHDLMATPTLPPYFRPEITPIISTQPLSQEHAPLEQTGIGLGKALAIVMSKYLLVQRTSGIALLCLNTGAYLLTLGQLRMAKSAAGLKAQPLLIPHALPASAQEIELIAKNNAFLQQFGIIIRQKSSKQIMIMSVCQPLRHSNLQLVIPRILSRLSYQESEFKEQDIDIFTHNFAPWLAKEITKSVDNYGLSQAITLISELELCWQNELPEHDSNLLRPINVAAAIEAFEYD